MVLGSYIIMQVKIYFLKKCNDTSVYNRDGQLFSLEGEGGGEVIMSL